MLTSFSHHLHAPPFLSSVPARLHMHQNNPVIKKKMITIDKPHTSNNNGINLKLMACKIVNTRPCKMVRLAFVLSFA